jgi:TonB-linked SusC/RagA family outer membrane protein
MNQISWQRALALLSLLLCLSVGAFAQEELKIRGLVKGGDDGEPLVGAAVQLVGGKAIPTNVEGKFELSAKMGDVIEVSFLGYIKESITITGDQALVIILAPASKVTSEILVVGYGTTNRKDAVGSIEKVSSKAFENIAMPSFDAGLQGRAAGVSITQQSGVLGSAVKVNIRGNNAITGNGNPLIVIDGMILYSGSLGNNDLSSRDSPVNASNYNTLANLDPNDIESVDILKDASATAIYGARAAGGVMIITTKSGKSGKTKFNAGYYAGFNQTTRKLPMLNGPEWMSLYNEARVNDGLQPLSGNQTFNVNGINLTPNTIANTNWQDEIFRQGIVQNATLSASGGTDKSRFFIGGSYRTDEGMLQGNKFDRFNVRANLKNNATDWLEIGIQVNPAYTKNRMVPTSFNGGIGAAQSNALPIFGTRNADGSYFGTQRAQGYNTGNNPLAALENEYLSNTFNMLGNVYAEIKFLPELKFRTSYQINYTSQRESFYTSGINRYANFNVNGRDTTFGLADLKERTVNALNWMTSNYFTYEKTFASVHNLKAVAGFELNAIDQEDVGWFTNNGAAGFSNPYARRLSSSIAWSQFATDQQKGTSPTTGYNSFFLQRWDSYFGRVSYNYDRKYIAEFSVRTDGTSNFGPDRRYGFFWSVGAGWNMSDETWFSAALPFVNLSKIRASYGAAGDPGAIPFGWEATYGISGGYQGVNGLSLNRLANPILQWANSRKFDVSLDYGFFNNRISGTLTYFNTVNTAILVNRGVPSSATGYIQTVYLNDKNAEVVNQGVEFTINSINVDMPNSLRWSSNLNLTFLRNKVTNTNGLGPDAFGDSPGDTRVIQGQPLGISFLAQSAGVDPQTGKEMIYVVDANGNRTGAVVEANATTVPENRVAIGNPQPTVYGGFTNELSFKGFDLSFLFSFSLGNTVYDDGGKRQIGGFSTTWNQRREVLERWQKPGDVTSVPRLTSNTSAGNWNNIDRFLYDGSFVRLKNITLGYTIPREWSSKMKLASCRVFVGGTNLLTFTRFPGFDPEVSRYQFSATDGNIAASAPYLATPQMMTFIGGFNIGF